VYETRGSTNVAARKCQINYGQNPEGLVAHWCFDNPHMQEYHPDFSVVLFRSDFVLFSEKNHVEALTNQWLLDRPYAPEHFSRATSRGHTMAPEAQTPSR
jgi:hypothetical protein